MFLKEVDFHYIALASIFKRSLTIPPCWSVLCSSFDIHISDEKFILLGLLFPSYHGICQGIFSIYLLNYNNDYFFDIALLCVPFCHHFRMALTDNFGTKNSIINEKLILGNCSIRENENLGLL